jgi:hypothetical protein
MNQYLLAAMIGVLLVTNFLGLAFTIRQRRSSSQKQKQSSKPAYG